MDDKPRRTADLVLLMVVAGLVVLAWPVELKAGHVRPVFCYLLPPGTLHR